MQDSGVGGTDDQRAKIGNTSTGDTVNSRSEIATASHLQAIALAHTDLLVIYVGILQRTSWLKTFRVKPSSPEQVEVYKRSADPYQRQWAPMNMALLNWFAAGYLVRLFVVSHIKSKLNELSLCYLTLLAAVPSEGLSVNTGEPVQLKEWSPAATLDKAQQVCGDVAKGLPSGHGPFAMFSAIWPIATGLLLAKAGFDDLYKAVFKLNLASIVSVSVALLPPALYGVLLASNSFLYKRELFLPGAWFLERGKRFRMEPPAVGTNAYAAEDRLFQMLGRKKRNELPLDVVIATVGFFVIGVAAVSVTIWLIKDKGPIEVMGFHATALTVVGSYVSFVYLLVTFSDLLIPLRRKWR